MSILNQTLTVEEVSSRIQAIITGDPVLQSLNVKGEILEFKKHGSGHVYFSLSGGDARLSGVMFRSDTRNVPQWPKQGDEVIVQGRIATYPARSSYQIYARNIIPIGLGAAARAREEIRKKLADEGLFDPRLKRPLPSYPSSIAIITSPTGAAIRDVIKVASYRFPSCSIIIVPTLVQGLEASSELVKALRYTNSIAGIDAAILARGGGSRDDLNPFDDELVVRAVRNVAVPIITGLGHQIDLTLCDLAADVSAPTPSAAAETLFPDRAEVSRLLNNDLYKLGSGLLHQIEIRGNYLDRQFLSLIHTLKNAVHLESSRVSDSSQGILSAMNEKIHRNNLQLSRLASSLNALSPLSVLGRGFITCQSVLSDKVIVSVSELEVNSRCSLNFKDGTALAEIKSKSSSEDH